MLRVSLANHWQARLDFVSAGLSKDRCDPMAALAETLVSAALWPHHSAAAAVDRARAVRRGRDAGVGPAIGSLPVRGGRTNPQSVDLAVPWQQVLAVIPQAADFAQRRRRERAEWDREQGIYRDAPGPAQMEDLARIQVKARHAYDAPDLDRLDAVRYPPADRIRENDLFLAVLFARVDEDGRPLDSENFVWTAVAITDDALRDMDPGQRCGRLDWHAIHDWWQYGLPPAAFDATAALRAVQVEGW